MLFFLLCYLSIHHRLLQKKTLTVPLQAHTNTGNISLHYHTVITVATETGGGGRVGGRGVCAHETPVVVMKKKNRTTAAAKHRWWMGERKPRLPVSDRCDGGIRAGTPRSPVPLTDFITVSGRRTKFTRWDRPYATIRRDQNKLDPGFTEWLL